MVLQLQVWAFMLLQDFPCPTPAPLVEVRQGTGHVKSLGKIDRLFEGAHEHGIMADQPVDVVGTEFLSARASRDEGPDQQRHRGLAGAGHAGERIEIMVLK